MHLEIPIKTTINLISRGLSILHLNHHFLIRSRAKLLMNNSRSNRKQKIIISKKDHKKRIKQDQSILIPPRKMNNNISKVLGIEMSKKSKSIGIDW